MGETQAGTSDNNASSRPNNPPTDLNSTAPLNFAENLPIGSVIGEFNGTDPDANTALTYHLVSGDNNNSFFTLSQMVRSKLLPLSTMRIMLRATPLEYRLRTSSMPLWSRFLLYF